MSAKKSLAKILVAVDGSVSSLMAEETAAIVARKTESTVSVLHATEDLRPGYQLPPIVRDEIVGHLEQRAEKIINDAEALFKEEKVAVDTKTLVKRDPAESILELSKDYDLIVMGGRGENEKDPYALGSVTKKVMLHTTRPTLITKRVSPLTNLLVCIDGSESSMQALDYAVRLAEKLGSKITVLNVQDRRIFESSPKTVQEFGEKILSKALNSIGKAEVQIDKKLEFGVPSDTIVEVAEKEKHDLIVLGNRGLGSVKRFLLGSVSDDVSHKAKCSVLMVPAKT